MDKIALLRDREKQHAQNISEAVAFVNSFVDEQSFTETNDYLTLADLSDSSADAVVTGYASVAGRPVAVAVQNPAVNHGGISKATALKLGRIMEGACKKKIPFIFAIDSFGAKISEGMNVLKNFAVLVENVGKLTANVPFIAVAKGHCVGNAALIASMADVTVGLENSVVSVNSPVVVLASDNKPNELKKFFGSAQAAQNGSVSVVTDKKNLGVTLTNILSCMPLSIGGEIPVDENADVEYYNQAVSALEDKRGSELITKLVDAKSFVELNKGLADNITTGFAKVCGIPVGIAVQNKPELCEKCVRKLAKFVKLCRRMGLPFINLVDCEGVKISMDVEKSEIARELGELEKELILTNKKIAVIVGKAIGLGYTVMASNEIYDSVLAWASAQISPLTAQAGGIVMYSDKIKAKDIFKSREEAIKLYAEVDSDAFTAATAGLAENVIAPENTRQYLLSRLQLINL